MVKGNKIIDQNEISKLGKRNTKKYDKVFISWGWGVLGIVHSNLKHDEVSLQLIIRSRLSHYALMEIGQVTIPGNTLSQEEKKVKNM